MSIANTRILSDLFLNSYIFEPQWNREKKLVNCSATRVCVNQQSRVETKCNLIWIECGFVSRVRTRARRTGNENYCTDCDCALRSRSQAIKSQKYINFRTQSAHANGQRPLKCVFVCAGERKPIAWTHKNSKRRKHILYIYFNWPQPWSRTQNDSLWCVCRCTRHANNKIVVVVVAAVIVHTRHPLIDGKLGRNHWKCIFNYKMNEICNRICIVQCGTAEELPPGQRIRRNYFSIRCCLVHNKWEMTYRSYCNSCTQSDYMFCSTWNEIMCHNSIPYVLVAHSIIIFIHCESPGDTKFEIWYFFPSLLFCACLLTEPPTCLPIVVISHILWHYTLDYIFCVLFLSPSSSRCRPVPFTSRNSLFLFTMTMSAFYLPLTRCSSTIT